MTTAHAKEMRIIEDSETDLDYRKESILRRLGWVHSSSYVDCCWRWSKDFKGKTITEDTAGAFSLELSLLEDEE